jgi:hypothetical protein
MKTIGANTMAKRPTRQKKDDRILHKGATAAQVRCDMALAPFDNACREMERKWGVDVLPDLVSTESAEKWGRAMAGLNSAIDSEDPDKTKFWVEICLRGLTAMDAEAVSLGRPVSDPDIWEHEYEGQVYGIIEDGREWPAAYAKRPGIAIHTMREVAVALHEHRNGLVNAVKLAFPGAEVKAVRRAPQDLEDDFNFLEDL